MRNVTVKLMGGIGNQMFQYAAGYKVAKRLGSKITFDTNFLEDRTTGVVYRDFDLSIFKNIDNDISNAPDQYCGKFVINEEKFPIILNDRLLDQIDQDIYIDGFFQRHNLVDESLKDIFVFSEYESDGCVEIDKSAKLSNSLMINVRRADYVSRKNANLFHGVLEMNYFKSSINKLPFECDRIFVFSDDVEWCHANFSSFKNVKVVEHNLAGHKFKDYLQMMSKFSNIIIPNSTFAWWAAWLSDSNKIAQNIIAPGKSLWFSGAPGKSVGLIPENWTSIEKFDISC